MSRTFTSLKIRNYRLYYVGQFVSMTGTWMQSLAQGWLVLRLTHNSGSALGVVVALQFLPMLLIGAWGGVIADRYDKRKVLMITQSAMGLVAGGLAVVTIGGVVTLWMVYLASFLTGIATAFDQPSRQAFVSEMVGPEVLTNAVSLNSAMFNAARIIGPAIGGILISLVDIGPCFAYNSLSYIAMIVALAMMRPDELFRGLPAVRKKGQIREGLRYSWRKPELRTPLIVVAVVGTLALNFTIVLPVYIKVTFHSGAGVFGVVTAFMGLGSLIGALLTANRQPTARLLAGSCVAFGVLMTGAALAPTLAAGTLLLFVMGIFSMMFMAVTNTTLQLASDPAMRGRVMALYAILFLGSTPIGGPIVGWICQHFSPRYGLAVGGVATILAGFYAGAVLLHAHIRTRRGPLVAGPEPSAEPAAA
jgi:MFS family permease